MTDRLQRLLDADKACSETVAAILPAGQGCGLFAINEEEWDRQAKAFAERDAARAALMPTEQDAIKLMFEAFTRLKDLGWREAIYCPKDGTEFDAIEPGSTGIHATHYSGEWPDGGWWVSAQGDLWPSRPVLYRPTEAERAKWAERKNRFIEAAQSHGSQP